MDQFESWIARQGFRCSGNGLWIAVERQQAPRRSQSLQYRPRMASPSERSVHITAIRFQVQARNRGTQENRHVVTGTFSFFVHSAGTVLQGEGFELSRQIGVIAIVQPPVSRFVPALFIPQFEPVTLAEQDCLPIQPGKLAQLTR